MSIIRAGSEDGTALVLEPGYPQKELYKANSWKLTYKYWCLATLAESLIPAIGAACPDGDHSTLDCKHVLIVPHPKTPGMASVTVSYQYPYLSGNVAAKKDGQTVKELRTVTVEMTLDDSRVTAAQKAAAEANGQNTVFGSTVEYTYIEYATSYTWSQANVISNLAATGAPTGLSSATAANWMNMGVSVRDAGELIEKRTTWLYHAGGWPA